MILLLREDARENSYVFKQPDWEECGLGIEPNTMRWIITFLSRMTLFRVPAFAIKTIKHIAMK
jgi:hypothetical protein